MNYKKCKIISIGKDSRSKIILKRSKNKKNMFNSNRINGVMMAGIMA